MSKKKKSSDATNTLLKAAVIGLVAYLLLNRRQSYTSKPYTAFPEIPAQPVGTTAAFDTWVKSIMQIYGTTKQLWEPGGPFYKLPKDLYDRVPNPYEQPPIYV